MWKLVFILYTFLPIFQSAQRECYTQTCNQLIRGRQLRYQNVLRIIQNEEYLDEADLDFLRKIRVKRQIFNTFYTLQDLCLQYSKNDSMQILTTLNNFCHDGGGAKIASYPGIFTNVFTGEMVTLSNSTECLEYGLNYLSSACETAEESTTTPNINTDSEVVRPILVATAIFGGAMLATFPSFPLVNQGLVPPGNPLPGTPFGGGLPSTGSPELLALAPPGLTPVAVFPPFATRRAVPAEALIFSEAPRIGQVQELFGKRRKRSIFDWFSFNIWKRRILIEEKVSRLFRTLKYKLNILERNAKCLRTRLYAWTHQREINELRRISRYFKPTDTYNYDEDINSIDDCIEGVEEPLYGFVVNVTVAQDSSCTLGVTCRESRTFPNFKKKQSGEIFAAIGPPTCRVRFNPNAFGCS